VVRWMRLERYTTRYCWLTHVASHGIVFSVDVPAIAVERAGRARDRKRRDVFRGGAEARVEDAVPRDRLIN